MKKKSKRIREKRFRPEKLISEREFLTGEHRTKEDLPRDMLAYVTKNPVKKVKEKSEPKVNSSTKKYLGSGKKPKWMNCQEEVDEDA